MPTRLRHDGFGFFNCSNEGDACEPGQVYAMNAGLKRSSGFRRRERWLKVPVLTPAACGGWRRWSKNDGTKTKGRGMTIPAETVRFVDGAMWVGRSDGRDRCAAGVVPALAACRLRGARGPQDQRLRSSLGGAGRRYPDCRFDRRTPQYGRGWTGGVKREWWHPTPRHPRLPQGLRRGPCRSRPAWPASPARPRGGAGTSCAR